MRATRELAKDLGASLEVSKPLFEKLSHWEASLPPQLKVDASFRPPDKCYFHISSAAYLRVACLTLNVYIYRALMRPLSGVAIAGGAIPDINPPGQRESSSSRTSININTRLQDTTEYVRTGAIDCVKRILEIIRKFDSLDRISFWSSCECALARFFYQICESFGSDMRYILCRVSDVFFIYINLYCSPFDPVSYH